MSLAGKGAVAIWQDLIPEARQDYYEWHNRQHVPERLGIPGFRRARRFVAVHGGPQFYTLYEADSYDDVSGKAYVRVVAVKKGAGGAYTFTALMRERVPGFELEPNDRKVDATPMQPSTITRSVNPALISDMF